MKTPLILSVFALFFALTPTHAAQAHDHVRLSFGFGCCAYPSYPAPYYYEPYYAAPTYYAPAPVYYAAPAPRVVYVDRPIASPALPASQTSATYIDEQGRSCRGFQATMSDRNPVNGTACLQQDGTWRTVE